MLGRYVYELRLLDKAQAIQKITGKSAETLGLQNPGFIKPEFVADLVLFDPDTVSDFADYDRPELPSAGIIYVFADGKHARQNGDPTQICAGRFLKG